jgi:hypothetical protein
MASSKMRGIVSSAATSKYDFAFSHLEDRCQI